MVKQKKPTLVFLMETKLHKEKMELVRCKLGFSSIFVVDQVGRSGGMALFWGEEISVTIIILANAIIMDWLKIWGL